MNSDRFSISETITDSSPATKVPDSIVTPNAFSKPTPGPASWRSKVDDSSDMVLFSTS